MNLTTPIYRVADQHGQPCWLHRPELDYVRQIVGFAIQGQPYDSFTLPARGIDMAGADNRRWILGAWLTGCWTQPRTNAPGRSVAADLFHRNPSALYAMVEAYCTSVEYPDGRMSTYEEACCDGETFSPDFWACGIACKSPASMAHDLICDQHKAGVPDVTGKVWTYSEWNGAFLDIYRADDRGLEGLLKWRILNPFGRSYWNSGESHGGITARSKT